MAIYMRYILNKKTADNLNKHVQIDSLKLTWPAEFEFFINYVVYEFVSVCNSLFHTVNWPW